MTTITVSSIAAALSAFNTAAMGDIVQMTDGTYDNTSEVDMVKASAAAIVTFKAQNQGMVTLTGETINFPADNTIIQGFNLSFDHASGDYCSLDGDNIKLLRNVVRFADTGAGTDSKWFPLGGDNIEVAYNDMGVKNSNDDLMSGIVYNLNVHHNYFHDVNADAQVMRIGDSANCHLFLNPVFAYNRVENCPQTGETETISTKCCGMDMHHNTFKNNVSSPTFRHGHGNKFRHNISFNGGVRVYGKDNEIMFNQFFNNSHNQLRQCMIFGNGTIEEDPTGGVPHAEYSRVKNNKIKYNIIDNGNASNLQFFNIGFNTIGATFDVRDNEIVGNMLTASTGTLTWNEQGSLFSNNNCQGNIVHPTGTAVVGSMTAGMYVDQALPIIQHPDGTYRCVFQQLTTDVGPNAP